jgi:hypothetical protein
VFAARFASCFCTTGCSGRSCTGVLADMGAPRAWSKTVTLIVHP